MNTKTIFTVLIILNAIVLLGQLWPEGAPPFARVVNIITIIANIASFAAYLKKQK